MVFIAKVTAIYEKANDYVEESQTMIVMGENYSDAMCKIEDYYANDLIKVELKDLVERELAFIPDEFAKDIEEFNY